MILIPPTPILSYLFPPTSFTTLPLPHLPLFPCRVFNSSGLLRAASAASQLLSILKPVPPSRTSTPDLSGASPPPEPPDPEAGHKLLHALRLRLHPVLLSTHRLSLARLHPEASPALPSHLCHYLHSPSPEPVLLLIVHDKGGKPEAALNSFQQGRNPGALGQSL